jgi:hypothetical protein
VKETNQKAWKPAIVRTKQEYNIMYQDNETSIHPQVNSLPGSARQQHHHTPHTRVRAHTHTSSQDKTRHTPETILFFLVHFLKQLSKQANQPPTNQPCSFASGRTFPLDGMDKKSQIINAFARFLPSRPERLLPCVDTSASRKKIPISSLASNVARRAREVGCCCCCCCCAAVLLMLLLAKSPSRGATRPSPSD